MDDLRAALAEIVGARGVSAAGVVTPTASEQVARVCLVCAAAGRRIAVTSGPADRQRAGSAAEGIVLSLARLDALDVDGANLVARAEAGVTLVALDRALGDARLTLVAIPSTSPPAPEHVGSLVARGGLPRRALCGIEAVLPSGDSVHSGGRVLKDVTGYDLAAVLLGSAGRLAVITAVHLRLQPAHSRREAHEAAGAAAVGSLGELVRAAFDPHGLLAAG